MRFFLIIFLINFMLVGCFEDKIITKEDCKKLGKTYKIEKVLNLRNGKYEDKSSCL